MDDSEGVEDLVSTVSSISNSLDASPGSWQKQLTPIRGITSSLDLSDTSPDEVRKRWQLSLICVFQRVAFADADNGGVQDVADWCLRQLLVLLQLYPEDGSILDFIGRYWLSRAQKSLANIFREQGSSSSEGSTSTRCERQAKPFVDSEEQLHTADYVEARGLLQPATEYLQRAVEVGQAQGNTTGALFSTAAEAFMSLGNVTSTKFNDRYFERALNYLQAAADLPGYTLCPHLQHYLDEVGPLYLHT